MSQKDWHGVVVLNGASSSGKTTLARAMQVEFGQPVMHLEEDRFVLGTYLEDYVTGEDAERIFRMTMHGFYKCIAALAAVGHDLIVDTGFYSRDLVNLFVTEVAGLDLWMVGVHADPAVLSLRERARQDREPGLAELQALYIHDHAVYDLEVDTSRSRPSESARGVVEYLRRALAPTAAEILRTGRS